MKNQINTALQAVCRQGLLDGVSSAVVAGVSVRQERGRLHACFAGGRTRMDGAGMPVDEGTVFDLASLSVTVTFDRYDVPVFDTTNDTDNGEPAVTDTPGAVFASSSLIDFTMLTPAVAGAYACAGSLSSGSGNG